MVDRKYNDVNSDFLNRMNFLFEYKINDKEKLYQDEPIKYVDDEFVVSEEEDEVSDEQDVETDDVEDSNSEENNDNDEVNDDVNIVDDPKEKEIDVIEKLLKLYGDKIDNLYSYVEKLSLEVENTNNQMKKYDDAFSVFAKLISDNKKNIESLQPTSPYERIKQTTELSGNQSPREYFDNYQNDNIKSDNDEEEGFLDGFIKYKKKGDEYYVNKEDIPDISKQEIKDNLFGNKFSKTYP